MIMVSSFNSRIEDDSKMNDVFKKIVLNCILIPGLTGLFLSVYVMIFCFPNGLINPPDCDCEFILYIFAGGFGWAFGYLVLVIALRRKGLI